MKTQLKENKATSKSYSFWHLAFYPTGVYKIWKYNPRKGTNFAYTIIYLPLFLLMTVLISMNIFAFFLPPLDLSVGERSDRTLFNPEGSYAVTFIATGVETRGQYELIQVDLEPKGGNDWHYHNTFDEEFTTIKGEIEIGLEGKIIQLRKGETVKAEKNKVHYFHNPSENVSVLLVKTLPARGLEKTLRIAYGLNNDGLSVDGLPKSFWHVVLLLGYSESYFGTVPSFIQDPFVVSLSKIAQWLGYDKELEKYYK